jgi:hypothetical protein
MSPQPAVKGTGFGLALAVLLLAAGRASTARAEEAFRCALVEAQGLPEADAATATRLLCDAIEHASGGKGRFGIRLGTLGRIVVVTATREDQAASVTVRVAGAEELPVAAARIADALVHGLSFPATQRVDNLLEAETRPAKTKKGSVKFSLGVGDVESPGFGARSTGFSLGLLYAAPRFALPAEVRFAFDDYRGGEPQLDLSSISVGGRYYFSTRDLSPFAGAGLGVLHLKAARDEFSETGYPGAGYFYADRFGLAAYVEAGVEVLRLHRGRIALHARADLPTWSLESDGYAVYAYGDAGSPYPDPAYSVPARSLYVVPVSIGLTVAF